jgi:hypothetical protein
VIPDSAFAEGVPAKVKREHLVDDDRQAYFGVLPRGWTPYAGGRIAVAIRTERA